MTNTSTLLCTTREDLLGVPELLLGFAPHESLVAVHLLSNQIEFCLRIDVAKVLSGPCVLLERMAQASASGERAQGEWLLVGYTLDPFTLAPTMHYIESMAARVSAAYITDGRHSWLIDGSGSLVDEQACDASTRVSTAQAVFDGQQVGQPRSTLVARIPAWSPAPGAAARASLLQTHVMEHERMDWLRQIADGSVAVGSEEEVSGLLLVDDECAVDLARTTKTWNAPARLANVLTALRWVPAEGRGNALAVAGLTAWLANEGVLAVELLKQLAEVAPKHAMLRILTAMMEQAIPPRAWNEL